VIIELREVMKNFFIPRMSSNSVIPTPFTAITTVDLLPHPEIKSNKE
jgi:hypothetical protein